MKQVILEKEQQTERDKSPDFDDISLQKLEAQKAVCWQLWHLNSNCTSIFIYNDDYLAHLKDGMTIQIFMKWNHVVKEVWILVWDFWRDWLS